MWENRAKVYPPQSVPNGSAADVLGSRNFLRRPGPYPVGFGFPWLVLRAHCHRSGPQGIPNCRLGLLAPVVTTEGFRGHERRSNGAKQQSGMHFAGGKWRCQGKTAQEFFQEMGLESSDTIGWGSLLVSTCLFRGGVGFKNGILGCS